MNGPCTDCGRNSGDAKKGGGLWLPPDSQDVRSLRREAAEAGDLEQVRLCDLALGGDRSALEACLDVIVKAGLNRNGRALCADCRDDMDDGVSPWRSA